MDLSDNGVMVSWRVRKRFRCASIRIAGKQAAEWVDCWELYLTYDLRDLDICA